MGIIRMCKIIQKYSIYYLHIILKLKESKVPSFSACHLCFSSANFKNLSLFRRKLFKQSIVLYITHYIDKPSHLNIHYINNTPRYLTRSFLMSIIRLK